MPFPRVSLNTGWLLLAASSSLLFAQSPAVAPTSKAASQARTTTIKGPTETMTVVGTAVPIPLTESTGSVTVLPVDSDALVLDSPQDLLRTDSSVFLESRGAGGGQADLVLRGGTFEQSLILLNGFRINDAQTSHHNLDLPLPLGAINSIQILHGAGSTLHGTDALSGVADFVTAAPTHSSLRVSAGAGSYWENEETVIGDLVRKRFSSRLTGERNFSEGFITDRDYRNEDTSLETWAGSKLGITDVLLAISDRSFGAANFYGNYPEWERTKSWFASARQELGSRTVASFGYRRHTDEFVLIRDNPSIYENNHIDGSWQAALQRTIPIGKSALILIGVDSDGDSIHSNALGDHARNRGSGYIDLDLHPENKRWSLSAGLREEIFSGGNSDLAPHLAGSYRLTNQIKLRASGGFGYRIPTYTDLYYTDPVTNDNPNLKPESAWSGEGGVDWTINSRLTFSATGFYTRQHDTIDYVEPVSTNYPQMFTPVNLNSTLFPGFSGVHFQGVETFLNWTPSKSNHVQIGWTAMPGTQGTLTGVYPLIGTPAATNVAYRSEYAYNYPTENINFNWTTIIGRWLTLTNNVRVVKMYQQAGNTPINPDAYPVWNATLNHDSGRVRPYLRLDNLSNTGYQEIVGVPVQGRSIVGGIAFLLGR